MKQPNYEAWALDLCQLLDAIEQVADSPDEVRELTQRRFEIAEKHGLKVVMLPHLTAGSA